MMDCKMGGHDRTPACIPGGCALLYNTDPKVTLFSGPGLTKWLTAYTKKDPIFVFHHALFETCRYSFDFCAA